MSFQKAFNPVQEEYYQLELHLLSGSLPEWLDGDYIKNGVGSLAFGNEKLEHWFDGSAMVMKVRFQPGKNALFTNKFIDSISYIEGKRQLKITHRHFATAPNLNFFSKIVDWFKEPVFGHNANVNVLGIQENFYALTESPGAMECSKETLETKKLVFFAGDNNAISGKLTTPHPHIDHAKNELINFETKLGPQSSYRYYRLDLSTRKTELIGTISTTTPSYTHSFGVTEKYIIHVEFPLVVHPLKLRFGNAPYIKNFRWKPELGSVVSILDKHDGRIVATKKTHAYFAFHIANCYEHDSEIIVDIPLYSNAQIVDDFYIDSILKDMRSPSSFSKLTRLTIPLGAGEIQVKTICEDPIDLPVINYRNYNAKKYRYVYGVGVNKKQLAAIGNALIKIDIKTGDVLYWFEEAYVPGEPLFVQKPNARAEDDGILISIASCFKYDKAYVLILDASDLSEVCRLALPQAFPPGFHGNFFASKGG